MNGQRSRGRRAQNGRAMLAAARKSCTCSYRGKRQSPSSVHIALARNNIRGRRQSQLLHLAASGRGNSVAPRQVGAPLSQTKTP